MGCNSSTAPKDPNANAPKLLSSDPAYKSKAQGPTVFTSPYGAVEIPNQTIPQEIFRKCSEFGDRVAMIDGPSGTEWTFKKLMDDAKALAGGLAAAGLQVGDTAAVYFPNTPEYFVVFHGVLLGGSVVTTLNPLYGPEEMQHCMGLTRPAIVFTCDALFRAAKEAASQISLDVQFVIVESREKWSNVKDDELAKPAKAFSEMLSPGAPYTEATDENALAVLPYSSGTTGMPKAVMLTHRNIVSQLYQLGTHDDAVKLTMEDTLLAVLPFFHIYGMVLLMELAIWSGAKVVTIPKFAPDLYLKLLKEHNVTIAHVAPPLVNFLAKSPAVEQALPLPHLRELFCGAAPLGDDLAKAAKERLNLQFVRQGYGMTEMSPASHVGPRSKPKGGSIGCVVPGMEMKLVNPVDGSLVTGPGQDGEIWLRGPNIMKGYYKNEDETKATIDAESFLHTGDVAYIDEDNQVWIVDRIKELIKVKGFQVAPAELEATLVKHPKIADAAVIGVAAGYSYGGQAGDGQVPKAFVVKKEESLTEDEVKEFVKFEFKAPYKQIAAVEFIEAVPKSASGKILRKNLRKREEDAGGKVFA
jgi:acyl-CoA synthetase (AMP-forming)/AMP-acid ligase II